MCVYIEIRILSLLYTPPQQHKQKPNTPDKHGGLWAGSKQKYAEQKRKGKRKPEKNAILNNVELIANNKNHPARLAGKSGKSPGRWVTAAD